jgi:hypothetical protein
MNINISKDDINEHLWFQRMLEARLHAETLRRAIEAGCVPSAAEGLHRFEVAANYAADAVTVSYTVFVGRHARDVEHYTESYTLAEVLRLALTEKP